MLPDFHYIHNNPEGGFYYYCCFTEEETEGTGRLSNFVQFLEAGRRHCNLSQSDSKACVIIYCVPGASDGRMGLCDIQEGQALSGLQGGCLFQEATPTIAVCPGLASSFLVKNK